MAVRAENLCPEDAFPPGAFADPPPPVDTSCIDGVGHLPSPSNEGALMPFVPSQYEFPGLLEGGEEMSEDEAWDDFNSVRPQTATYSAVIKF